MNDTKISADDVILQQIESASPQEEAEMALESSVVLEPSTGAKADVVNELHYMRTANGKVFLKTDGTHRAIFHSAPIHVFDEVEQRFVECNEIFEEDTEGKFLERKHGRFTAKFSREDTTDELFEVESGNHRVTFLAKRTSKQREKTLCPKKQDNHLVYEAPMANTQYEYAVTGNRVKENIIVRKKKKKYEYPFIVEMDNLQTEMETEAKTVTFVDAKDGTPVFTIPAPYMTDAVGVQSGKVHYEIKQSKEGKLALTVVADSEWMNADDRVFPVVIDPQVQLAEESTVTTYGIIDEALYETASYTLTSTCSTCSNTCTGCGFPDCDDSGDEEETPSVNESDSSTETDSSGPAQSGINCSDKIRIEVNLPTLSRNPNIKKVWMKIQQSDATVGCGTCPKLGVYATDNSNIDSALVTTEMLVDYAVVQSGKAEYAFDITALADYAYQNGTTKLTFDLKLINSSATCVTQVTVCGSASSTNAPTLEIDYESNLGINTSGTVHSHELGRLGTGSVDLRSGTLMFESNDFTWSGNRMPVTIKHLYTSALGDCNYTQKTDIGLKVANFSGMKLGNGWKLNLMQSMIWQSFVHEGKTQYGYIFTDENGNEMHFIESDASEHQKCCSSCTACYKLFADTDGSGYTYNRYTRELDMGDQTYTFDANGRLVSIRDAHNEQQIVYEDDKIAQVIDGAGRIFALAYNTDNSLASITAPDGSKVQYGYSNGMLTEVSYPAGIGAMITYSNSKPQSVVLNNGATDCYKVAYTFSGDRVTAVKEFGYENAEFVDGVETTYEYSAAARRTVLTTTELEDGNTIKTVYAFDDEGNEVSHYVYSTNTGNDAGGELGSGIHPYAGDSGMGMISNVHNLLLDHNFESLDHWSGMSGNLADYVLTTSSSESNAVYGKSLLYLRSYQSNAVDNGVYQDVVIPAKGSYTFSAYVRSAFDANEVFLRVCTTDGDTLGESEHITGNSSEYTRLIVPFELDNATTVRVCILTKGESMAYVNAAQLEHNAFANRYNLLTNGHFEQPIATGWNYSSDASASSSTFFNHSKSLRLVGHLNAVKYAKQTVSVKTAQSMRETFTLSGWAKGYAIPDYTRENAPKATFRLRAVIRYKNGGSEVHTADFSPCTEAWQHASVTFAKSRFLAISDIVIYCDYDYNAGYAYFDDIQLTRDSIETGLSSSDFSTTVNDEIEEDAITDTENDTTPSFAEAVDGAGNAITETTFTDGEFGTIYRAFGFDSNGNNMTSETDARGSKTAYTVDEATSRNEEVVYRCGNKTSYEYDKAGRTTKVTSAKPQYDKAGNKKTDSDGNILYDELADVSYAYDAFDNMTEIVRGDGMKYALAYNGFHNLESIGVDGMTNPLVKYTYKNGNGRLKKVTYANGHTMAATYNSAGQMVAEKWYDSNNVEKAHYKYVYDSDGNIVRSIDILAKKEYTYLYEGGNIIRAAEYDITLEGEIVTAKTLVNAIQYTYDSEGKMTKKFISGSGQTVYYEHSNDGNTVVKFSAGGRTVTSHSKNDSFGRKEFDELQLGTDFVSRQFVYHAGKVTAEHKEKAKVKSSATTQLVSQIILSNGTTLSYGYDAEERITSVVETYTVDDTPVTNTTLYTYDALGQLLTETVNGEVVNAMEYDNYGNIVEKNGKAYTYGDATWKDLLTGFDGKTIEYDAQGNPTSYLGHTLTWGKGRQLKSFDGNTYTYNANGIRTSKKVNGVLHTYTLDGTKILRETWDGNTLIPLYDNEDSVCGILYNGIPYYFIKNLQGDIIAIVDKDAETVARYSYDAWGVPTVTQDSSDCQIATITPFKYRSYYYDEEIGLYYLQSRYYNPQVGRFINADSIEWLGTNGNILETNIFAYCKNDCVNGIDDVGFGGVDALLNVLSSCIDVITGIIDMIGNSYNKERKSLESSVKLLSKKQRCKLSDINALRKETEKISDSLSWIGHVITFFTIVIGFAVSYKTGGNIDHSIIEVAIEAFIAVVEWGAGEFFGMIAKLIPYVGFLLGLIAGWLVSYLLGKYFNNKRVKRIKSKFSSLVKSARVSLVNWIKNAVKSLTA